MVMDHKGRVDYVMMNKGPAVFSAQTLNLGVVCEAAEKV